jgi:hypothetical protein
MKNFIEEAKQQLREGIYPNDYHESSELEELLNQVGSQRVELLRWVFAEHQNGYVNTRVWAGREFLKDNPNEGWKILQQLITSDKSEDRSTALDILEETNDPRAPALAKPLLQDNAPYLRFGAADFLKSYYPEEVIAALRDLLNHKEMVTRVAAKQRLLEMGVGADNSS